MPDRSRLIEWVSRLLDGTLDREEAPQLAALVRSDPVARRELARLLTQHAALRWVWAPREAAGEAVQDPAVPARGSRGRFGRKWVGLAASLLMAAALGYIILSQGSGPKALGAVEETDPGVVQRHEGAWLTVAKGSPVWAGDELHTQGASALTFRYAGERTTLRLRGETELHYGPGDGKRLDLRNGMIEAEVAPQPAGQPLRVASPQAEVRVLGTKFLVRTSPLETRVQVDEGRVQVTSLIRGASIELPEGHFAVASGGSPLESTPLAEEISETLRNGGFETGSLAGWGDREAQPDRAITVGREYAHQGNFGVRLRGQGGFDQKLRTTPGQTYFVGGWVRIEKVEKPPTWGGVRVAVYPEGEGKDRWRPLVQFPFITPTKTLPELWTIVAPGQWTRVRFSFVAQTRVSTFRLDHFTDGMLDLWADDFVVSTVPLGD